MALILEFWYNDKQVAECPADDIFSMGTEQQINFWHVQDLAGRAIKARLENDERRAK